MKLSRFERAMPWTGAVAGLAWIGQEMLFAIGVDDSPGAATSAVIHQHLSRNHGGVACLVIMGVALVFFAAAVRSQLRSGEAREATYSSVAYGGLLLTSAGTAQMVVWSWALINGAADAGDDGALHVLGYANYFGWAGMVIGISTTFIAIGLAGVANRVVPRWFALVTLVLGVLGALGGAGIPPGGLVNYILLPFWLVAAAVILARRQRAEARLTSREHSELAAEV